MAQNYWDGEYIISNKQIFVRTVKVVTVTITVTVTVMVTVTVVAWG